MNSMPSRMSATRLAGGSFDLSAQVAVHERQRETGTARTRTASMARVMPGPIIAARNPAKAGPMMYPERIDGLEDRVRSGELRAPDDRNPRRIAREEQRAEDAHRGRDDQDDRHRRAAEQHRDRDQGGQGSTAEVGQEHHPLAGRCGRPGRPRSSRRTGRGASRALRRCPSSRPEPVSARTRSGRAVKLTASPSAETPCDV